MSEKEERPKMTRAERLLLMAMKEREEEKCLNLVKRILNDSK